MDGVQGLQCQPPWYVSPVKYLSTRALFESHPSPIYVPADIERFSEEENVNRDGPLNDRLMDQWKAKYS